MSITFDTIEVTKLISNHFSLSWAASYDGGDAVGDFNFYIYRSFAPNDDFSNIGQLDGASIPGPTFRDPDTQTINNRFRYYKIFAKHKTDPLENVWSSVVKLGDDPDGVLLTILYKHHILLNQYAGEPCRVMIAKTSGKRCPNCWDDLMLKPVEHYCLECFGTGYLDGFHNPIENVQIHIDPSPKVSAINTIGEDQEKGVRAWFSNDPLVKPRDLIISSHDNKRYRIIRIDRTSKKKRATIDKNYSNTPITSRQLLTLQEINWNDVEYSTGIIREPAVSTGFGENGFGTGNFWTEIDA